MTPSIKITGLSIYIDFALSKKKIRGFCLEVKRIHIDGCRYIQVGRRNQDLSVCESEECGRGEGWGVYATLMERSRVPFQPGLLFIMRVKRELKRVYRNGCRYNERLNAETGESKTPRTHWV